MLGASQWNWTGVKLDDRLGWYHPNQLTNGSFAMIYHSSIYQKLIESIDKMDSPFDSKPLKSIICNSEIQSSYVAWPNIVVADVEKEGIRDSRSQSAYASRFRWKMQDFPRGATTQGFGPNSLRNARIMPPRTLVGDQGDQNRGLNGRNQNDLRMLGELSLIHI